MNFTSLFPSPAHCVEEELSQVPNMTNVILPNVHFFRSKGDDTYLDALLSRTTARGVSVNPSVLPSVTTSPNWDFAVLSATRYWCNCNHTLWQPQGPQPNARLGYSLFAVYAPGLPKAKLEELSYSGSRKAGKNIHAFHSSPKELRPSCNPGPPLNRPLCELWFTVGGHSWKNYGT